MAISIQEKTCSELRTALIHQLNLVKSYSNSLWRSPSLHCENLEAFRQLYPETRYRENIFKIPEYKMFQKSQAFPTLLWFYPWQILCLTLYNGLPWKYDMLNKVLHKMTSGYVHGVCTKQKWFMLKIGLYVQESFFMYMQIFKNSKQFYPPKHFFPF